MTWNEMRRKLSRAIRKSSLSGQPQRFRRLRAEFLEQRTVLAAVPALVSDINLATDSSSPQELVVMNNTLYFVAVSAAEGSELWRSDGTAGGTSPVTDIVQ